MRVRGVLQPEGSNSLAEMALSTLSLLSRENGIIVFGCLMSVLKANLLLPVTAGGRILSLADSEAPSKVNLPLLLISNV